MAQQNIFDNAVFFQGYKKIRDNAVNANILFEIPALCSMMPDLKGKKVLDLGCGFGEHCRMFVERGAEKVVGIDISSKMLDVAKQENSDPKIEYLNLPMEEIDYVEDFAGVVRNVYTLLDTDGSFVFSQEHPLVTCHSGGSRWTRDQNGEKKHVNLANYGVEGERETTWFVDHVKVYHRTFSNIVNTLLEAGFSVEQMIEPLPTPELLECYPDYKDLLHKPDFLLIKAKK